MDWYYPVLTGALSGTVATERFKPDLMNSPCDYLCVVSRTNHGLLQRKLVSALWRSWQSVMKKWHTGF